MSALALYPDGRTGDAFAKVCEASLAACFEQMAGEVADWLSGAIARCQSLEAPRAIELTLEWSGEPATEPAPESPTAPSDSAQEVRRPPSTRVRCATRRRLACAGRVGFAAPVAVRGTPS